MALQFFTTQDGRPLDWVAYKKHPLGQLHSTIPFQDYVKLIAVKENKPGPKGWFDVAGGIAVQILKHRYGCSDEKLIEQLNENKMMQYFCGIDLGDGRRIKDADVVSRWRAFLGRYLDKEVYLRGIQKASARAWVPHLDEQDVRTNLSDATCYESHVRYPTDEKLLWESVTYLYQHIKRLCKSMGKPLPRSKYKEQKQKFLSFQRKRRKTHKEKRRVRRRLLYLLNKYLDWMPGLIKELEAFRHSHLFVKEPLKTGFYHQWAVIEKVYEQQQLRYDDPSAEIKNRIVSLAKPYLRPIVRGKEVKRVEFGMKVNEMQVGGINFIDHWSFNAFHEGIRLPQTIRRHQDLFHKACKRVGADQIYATNANRTYCSRQNIFTCFQPKGRAPKDRQLRKQAKQMRTLLSKERATRLEGSFGNKKNHYLLGKIKAKNYYTELAWVFFGNLTANATLISKRINAPPAKMN